jgi:hypothetical protein
VRMASVGGGAGVVGVHDASDGACARANGGARTDIGLYE